ncbi:tetratricopeptide repeat protein [Haloferula sp. BvORR071]|uniref:tetratricopeptide repeat protein n=1 Tax=Haloferula sp. BvORR071 TaxID=1396141 RepID=UPI00054F4247|nr:tetratricopeptide repeat protein [Haloferula sp. BvORR071]
MKFRYLLCLAAAGVTFAQETPPKAEPVQPALQGDPGQDWYERGKNLYDSAKATEDAAQRKDIYARAIEVLSGYLAQFDKHANAEAAQWYLGESYAATGKMDEARRCYRAIVKRGGKSQFVMVAANKLAVEYYKAKNFAEAAPLYEKMAEAADTPDNRLKGLYFAAVAYGQMKNGAAKAAENYRKVAAIEGENPFRAASQLALGNSLVAAEKFAEALPFFEQAASDSNAAEVRGPAALQAAALAAKLGKQDLAAKYLELVLKTPGMEESHGSARLALMAAQFDRKEYEKVIELYRADPGTGKGEQDARRLMLAGRAAFEVKQYKTANEIFQKIAKHPDAGEWAYDAAYLRLLASYRDSGKHDLDLVSSFLDRYRKDHAADPKIQNALLIQAEALLDAKKPAEAAKAYQAINADQISAENRPGMLYNRARSLQESGNPKAAVTAYSDFIAAYPKDPRLARAFYNRALAHEANGSKAGALADYDALVDTAAPDDLKVSSYLASAGILAGQEKWPEAIKRYRAYLTKFPEDAKDRRAMANYAIAVGLIKAEQPKEALAPADQARKLDPKSYAKSAGLVIAGCQWTLQDSQATGDEVDVAIKEGYAKELSPNLITWAGTQAWQAKQPDRAARYFPLVANEKEPEKIPRGTWRLFGKSLLAVGKSQEALLAINRGLLGEEHPGVRAEGLLDKAKALVALGRDDEALLIAGECQDMRPEGQINTEIRLLTGDIYTKKNDSEKAIGAYVTVVEILNAGDLRPLALEKLATALENAGKNADAVKYRTELREKYPEWKGK